MNVQEVLRLTPVYELVDSGWTQARLLELPGVITTAPNREQAREMLVDALREFLLSFGPGEVDDHDPRSSGTDALTVTIAIPNQPAA